MATVAAIVGTEGPQEAAVDSVSLLPLLRGESVFHGGGAPVRDHLVHHSCLGVFSLRTSERAGNWKLIVECNDSGDVARGAHGGAGSGPVPGSPGQLYHMGDDPWEVYNRYRDNPEVVRELNDELERIRTAEGEG